jgi:uncharacterized membrane protein SirB2
MTSTYLQLHETGRAMMKKAHDKVTHGHKHARKVLENSEKILAELLITDPEKYDIDGIDLMVETASWWHDSYKRLQKKTSFYSLFHEGEEAEKIFLQNPETAKLSEIDQRFIAQAIREHGMPYKYFFNWRSMPPVTRVLLEADGVETVCISRIKHSIGKSHGIILKLFHVLLYIALVVFYLLMPLSRVARKIYWQNLLEKDQTSNNKHQI